MLDLSSLEKALDALDRALRRSDGSPDDEELRDAVVQRFALTFELCWKMLRRRLMMDAPNADAVGRMSYREVMREALARGLIEDMAAWLEYREMRDLTAHTYDANKAALVRAAAAGFAASARALLEALHRCQAAE